MDLIKISQTCNFAPGWDDFFKKKSVLNTLNQISKNINRLFPHEKLTPESNKIFSAFELTPSCRVKVVLVGQDPYPNMDLDGLPTAQGFSFSVREKDSLGNPVSIPSSLKNIFKEIKLEFPDWEKPIHGNLEQWATQGILLLNTSLTCVAGIPGSHLLVGWKSFIKEVMVYISEESPESIYVLWGKKAQDIVEDIRFSSGIKIKHILTSAHPSGLSASRGFFGNNHFKEINNILSLLGEDVIIW